MDDKYSSHPIALQQENKLLQERNEMLRHENQRMLCEIEMLNVELEHIRGHAQSRGGDVHRGDSEMMDNRQTYRRGSNGREEYEELVTLRLQRQQLNTLYHEKMSLLSNKANKGRLNHSMKDRIGLLASIESSGCYIGTIRGLFDLVEHCIDCSNSMEQKLSDLSDKETLLQLQQQQQSHKQNSRLLVIRDPQYVVHETRWITRFEDEFRIVKNFYEQLIGKVLSREQYRHIRPTMHTILLRYEQLELRKLEMYRLAVRIDNQERQYKVRLNKGTSMESLRLSTNKLVESLASEERQLNRLRSEISELVSHI